MPDPFFVSGCFANSFANNPSVDLVYLCSTTSATGVEAADLTRILRTTRDSSTAPTSASGRRKWTRLTDDQRSSVIHRYEDGETSTRLAAEFGVAKSTILSILRTNAVRVRRQPLTAEEVTDAARLYESGSSLSQVATELKVNQETMRVAIIAVGVTLRPPTQAKPLGGANAIPSPRSSTHPNHLQRTQRAADCPRV